MFSFFLQFENSKIKNSKQVVTLTSSRKQEKRNESDSFGDD